MSDYYARDGSPLALMEWAQAMEKDDRVIGSDKIGEAHVSTVWLVRGAVQAMLGLFNAAAHDDEIAETCGSDVAMLDSVLQMYAPLCCYVGDEVMAKVTGLALRGEIFSGEAE
jgi:hypothetical protein